MKISGAIFLATVGVLELLQSVVGQSVTNMPRINVSEAATVTNTNSNDLNLNFVNAPVDMVLNYLSDAAGFIIMQDAQVSGSVTVVGQHLTQAEAVNLLNTELDRKGCVAIRDGRTLTIVGKNSAKTRNIPVKTGNNPDAIPDNNEMATWIIPIRFVEAQQLISDLKPLISTQATVTSNEAGNSIVMTDTQSNIRHVAKIIQAVDNSARSGTEIRVFRLKYANPTDIASELSSMFPISNSAGDQMPTTFGGPGGPGGLPDFGPPQDFNQAGTTSGTTSSSSQQRIQKATQVTAVADSRVQAVIVSAPQHLMDQIAGIMTTLDVPSSRDQKVYVFQLKNGDPLEVAQVLKNMFASSTSSSASSSSSSTQTSALQQRQQTTATTTETTTSTSTTSGTSPGGGGGGDGF